MLGGSGEGNATGASFPGMDDKAMEALKTGIVGLAKTASQLSELGTLATATTDLGNKLDAAGQAAEQFAAAGKVITEKSAMLSEAYTQVTTDMQKVAADTKAYESQVNAISAQVLQGQTEAYKTQADKIAQASTQVDNLTMGVKSMLDTANDALTNHKAYAAGTKQLAEQVADLNKVYGNMLNALA